MALIVRSLITSKHNREIWGYVCVPCNFKTISAADMYYHTTGFMHEDFLSRHCPDMLPHTYSLQYFLEACVREEKLLGLEYIEELQSIHKENYMYKCHLCDVATNRKSVFAHITATAHMKKYVDTHHPEMLASRTQSSGLEVTEKALQKMLCSIASRIFRLYRRKRIIQTKSTTDEGPMLGPPSAKVAKKDPPSTDSDLPRIETDSLKPNHQGLNRGSPPSQKRDLPSRDSEPPRRETDSLKPSGNDLSRDPPSQKELPETALQQRRTAIRDILESTRSLPFQHTDEFLAYMRDFEIQNDEDATFIKVIIQNSTAALMKFRKEGGNSAAQGTPSSSHLAPVRASSTVAERVGHIPETLDKPVTSVLRCYDSSSLESEAVDKNYATHLQ